MAYTGQTLTVDTAPTVEPVTVADAKTHLRITHDDEDALIAGLIKAATAWAEHETGRALVQQTLLYTLDDWPAGDFIVLPKPPLRSVTSVKWLTTAGVETTLTASTDYVADTGSEPGRVCLPYNGSWPSSSLYPIRPIRVTYVAGYAPTTGTPVDYRANIPQAIKQAILLRVGDLYELREGLVQGAELRPTQAAEWLLAPYKVWASFEELNSGD